ncbi:MAG: integrase [Bacteroidia bacterium]|nr:tyrosine-type recombinase/integrase [Proteiniphilum sp.]NCB19887.1 integrase [Bacteroidia bacterium]
MKKTDKEWVGYWLKRYLQEYMPVIRNLSRNTITSYRDALHQLLVYIATKGYSIDSLRVEEITGTLVCDFLSYLESARCCSIQTRNQRLAAIHSFAEYIAISDPQYVYWFHKLKSIPAKRNIPREINGRPVPRIMYLEKDEMKALLDAPDRKTAQGSRDYALLMFLYNTGARASEVASMTIGNLETGSSGQMPKVTILGKGNKTRVCPLWESTVKLLLPLIDRSKDEHLFLNRYNEPITRFGIYEMVSRHAAKASLVMQTIAGKNVSPHIIRHSTASHLLEAGVDINTIRSWLGHVSVNTTNLYAEVNMRMKAEALKTCEIGGLRKGRTWKGDKSLLTFLKSI